MMKRLKIDARIPSISTSFLASIVVSLLVTSVFGAETPTGAAAPAPKYRAAKDVDFDELLIQGELKRPEVSIVTGNVQQGTDGLLRLRENFMDRISMDAGEELE